MPSVVDPHEDHEDYEDYENGDPVRNESVMTFGKKLDTVGKKLHIMAEQVSAWMLSQHFRSGPFPPPKISGDPKFPPHALKELTIRYRKLLKSYLHELYLSWCVALAPLSLSAYEMLWIFDWLSKPHGLRGMRLIEKVQSDYAAIID